MDGCSAAWLTLLGEQESLLKQLRSDIEEEQKALLADEVVSLRESSLQKDRTLSRFQEFQNKFASFRQQAAREYGLQSATLAALFDRYPDDERAVLQRKRADIARLSLTVQRQNQFNEECLKARLGHLAVMGSVLAMAGSRVSTYDAGGMKSGAIAGGKLVSRSF